MENKKSMLNFIFEARCEELAQINKKDEEFLNSKKANIDKEYVNFESSIEELPDKMKKNILEKFNNYSDTSDYITGYFNEKYYKIGFSDCMKLVLNCINI